LGRPIEGRGEKKCGPVTWDGEPLERGVTSRKKTLRRSLARRSFSGKRNDVEFKGKKKEVVRGAAGGSERRLRNLSRGGKIRKRKNGNQKKAEKGKGRDDLEKGSSACETRGRLRRKKRIIRGGKRGRPLCSEKITGKLHSLLRKSRTSHLVEGGFCR